MALLSEYAKSERRTAEEGAREPFTDHTLTNGAAKRGANDREFGEVDVLPLHIIQQTCAVQTNHYQHRRRRHATP